MERRLAVSVCAVPATCPSVNFIHRQIKAFLVSAAHHESTHVIGESRSPRLSAWNFLEECRAISFARRLRNIGGFNELCPSAIDRLALLNFFSSVARAQLAGIIIVATTSDNTQSHTAMGRANKMGDDQMIWIGGG